MNIIQGNHPYYEVHELGVQILPRPHLQLAWSLFVMPGNEPLKQLDIVEMFFEHNAKDNEKILSRFKNGNSICPFDPFVEYIEDKKDEKYLKKHSIDNYLLHIQKSGTNRPVEMEYLKYLFKGKIEIV